VSEQQPESPALPGEPLILAPDEFAVVKTVAAAFDAAGVTFRELAEALDHELSEGCWVGGRELAVCAWTYVRERRAPDLITEWATEPAIAPLTSAQCERLRQVAAEWGAALSAVRAALEYTAERMPTLKGAEIITAAREALKVLEGSEEESNGTRH
jgi:hypothetical protein